MYLQDKLADSFLAIPSKKKRKESKTKAVQHFVLQLWNSQLDIGKSLKNVLAQFGNTNSLSKNKDWDTSLALIKSPVVDSFCMQESKKRKKNLIFS